MRRSLLRCRALCLVIVSLLFVQAGAKGSQKYKVHENVPLFANKVGPFNNPSETYQYYSLPFCKPKDGEKYKVKQLFPAAFFCLGSKTKNARSLPSFPAAGGGGVALTLNSRSPSARWWTQTAWFRPCTTSHSEPTWSMK